jgi:hypothetical protein
MSYPRRASTAVGPLTVALALLAACSSSTITPGDTDAGPAPDSAQPDAPIAADAGLLDSALDLDRAAPPEDVPAMATDVPAMATDVPAMATDAPLADAGAAACRVIFTATLPDTTRFVPSLVADGAGAVWAAWFDRNGAVRGARVGDDAVYDAWVQPMARTRDTPTTLPFAGWWGGGLRVGLRNAPGVVLASFGPTGSLLGPTQPLSERDAVRNGPWIVPTTAGRYIFWQEQPGTSGEPMRVCSGCPSTTRARRWGRRGRFPSRGSPATSCGTVTPSCLRCPRGSRTCSSAWAPGGRA